MLWGVICVSSGLCILARKLGHVQVHDRTDFLLFFNALAFEEACYSLPSAAWTPNLINYHPDAQAANLFQGSCWRSHS